jgi:hypothetical protein
MQDNSVVEMRGSKPRKIDGFVDAFYRYLEVFGNDERPSILGLARAQHSGTLYDERGKLRRDVWGFDLNLSDEDEDDGDILKF